MSSSRKKEINKKEKKRILTKSSKPLRVPTISLSPFIITHNLDPIHLSTSSVIYCELEFQMLIKL